MTQRHPIEVLPRRFERISIEEARTICENVGSEIHWRPLNMIEEEQFALLLSEGEV
jgi:hypothetical protein